MPTFHHKLQVSQSHVHAKIRALQLSPSQEKKDGNCKIMLPGTTKAILIFATYVPALMTLFENKMLFGKSYMSIAKVSVC